MGIWDDFQPERKVEWEDIAQAIHDTVTMDEVVRIYIPSATPRRHRIPCPFHNGKDYNLSYTPHGYRCFVCGASGDVIGFVKDACELATRSDAMKRINQDFHLNLPIDANVDVHISAEIQRRRAEAERKREEIEAWESRYNALMDAWCKLDNESRVETDPYKLARIHESMNRLEYELDSMPEKPKG